MSGLKDPAQGAAAIVFVIVFTALTVVAAFAIATRRPRLRLISILLYLLVKLGGQISAIGWAVALYTNFNWLIAYLVLGAEGYFTLIICIIYSIVAYEVQTFGASWLHPAPPCHLTGYKRRFHFIFAPSFSPSWWIHQAIIPANVLVVVGGNRISHALSLADGSDIRTQPGVNIGFHPRTAGQALFLAATVVCYACAFLTFRKAHRERANTNVIVAILATAPFMFLRGTYGVVSSADFAWSYYNAENYGIHGLMTRQLIGEYVMGSAMECVTAMVLLATNIKLTHPRKSAEHTVEHGGTTSERREMAGKTCSSPKAIHEHEEGGQPKSPQSTSGY